MQGMDHTIVYFESADKKPYPARSIEITGKLAKLELLGGARDGEIVDATYSLAKYSPGTWCYVRDMEQGRRK